MKVCEVCREEIDTRDGDNRCPNCEELTKEKRKKARRRRSEMDQVMADLGMKKVRGAMGGVYYE